MCSLSSQPAARPPVVSSRVYGERRFGFLRMCLAVFPTVTVHVAARGSERENWVGLERGSRDQQ
ncbi:hypothetical protein GCM10027267_17190 [Paramicrobacterium agarici]